MYGPLDEPFKYTRVVLADCKRACSSVPSVEISNYGDTGGVRRPYREESPFISIPEAGVGTQLAVQGGVRPLPEEVEVIIGEVRGGIIACQGITRADWPARRGPGGIIRPSSG